VKWYKADKGYGFVSLENGGDAFIHVSVLQQAGHNDLHLGTSLEVRVGPGPKGLQVIEILSVDESTKPSGSETRSSAPERPTGSAVEMTGTVKWFDAIKGFGFVAIDGGKDVFVHASAVKRSGLSALLEGQRVTVEIINGQKGREVAVVRLVE
jgi:cold shock protein